MAEINWTEEAERWIKDIHNYIAQDSPESAVRVVGLSMKKRNYSLPVYLRDNIIFPLAPSGSLALR